MSIRCKLGWHRWRWITGWVTTFGGITGERKCIRCGAVQTVTREK